MVSADRAGVSENPKLTVRGEIGTGKRREEFLVKNMLRSAVAVECVSGGDKFFAVVASKHHDYCVCSVTDKRRMSTPIGLTTDSPILTHTAKGSVWVKITGDESWM